MNKPFPARYDGECADCVDEIEEGDMIVVTDGGAVHEDCARADLPDKLTTFPL